jgi:hypothetical protein
MSKPIEIDMSRLNPDQRAALERIAEETGKTLEEAAAWLIERQTRTHYAIPAPRRSVTPFRRKS